jgi:hypothetical protein
MLKASDIELDFDLNDSKLLYIGDHADGKKNGNGCLYKVNTLIFEGSFENDKIYKGRKYLRNGYYDGLFRNNMANCSTGILIVKSNSAVDQKDAKYMYQGLFTDDKFIKGDYYLISGEKHKLIYSGEFQDLKFHGNGRYNRDDGYVYEGIFVEGKLISGCCTDPDKPGNSWIGSFIDYDLEGLGEMYEGKDYYKGIYKKSEIEDILYANLDGLIIEKIKRSTYQIKYLNGDVYIGEIANDTLVPHGYGKLINDEHRSGPYLGDVFYGMFKNGHKDGIGYIEYKGELYTQTWKNGVLENTNAHSD